MPPSIWPAAGPFRRAYSTTDDSSFVVAHYSSLGYTGERLAWDYSVLAEFVINDQVEPTFCCAELAHDRSDSRELVAVWAEPPPGGWPDFDIKTRVFSGRIFADGFEAGDTSAWSAAVP